MLLNTRAATLMAGFALIAATQAQGVEGPAPLAWRWAEQASAAPGGSPVVIEDRIYVAVGGRIYCIEKETGNTLWRYPAGEPVNGQFRNGLSHGSGTIVAATDAGSVYAVNAADGTLKWQSASPSTITSNVVVVGNYVVYGSVNKILGFNLADGQPTSAEGYDVGTAVHSVAHPFNNGFLFSNARGELVLFNPVTQGPVWTVAARGMSVGGSFTVTSDRIYLNAGLFLACLNSAGRMLWQQNVNDQLALAPAANEEQVATMSRNGMLYTFNRSGRPVFGKGINLNSPAVVAPTFIGGNVCVSTQSGAITLVEPTTGEIVWTYTIPPIANRTSSGDTAGGATTPGRGPGGAPGGPGGGNLGNQRQEDSAPEVNYTQAAGTPVGVEGSLIVLTRDATVLLFDRALGVDVTPPTVLQLWPRVGSEISGMAPLELIFKLDDLGIGVRADSVAVTIDGTEYLSTMTTDGYLSVRVTATSNNKPLQNGRRVVAITASDWLGNTVTREFSLMVDNALPPLGSPRPREDSTSGGGSSGPGNPGGGPGAPGGRGGR